MSLRGFDILSDTSESTSNSVPEGSSPSVRVISQPGPASLEPDGSVVTQRPRGMNTAEFLDSGADILSTARTSYGSPRMGPLQPSDMVKIRGEEFNVKAAEMMGLLRRDASGNYSEVPGAADAFFADEKPQEAAADPGEALANAQVETELATLCSTVSPGLQIGALQEIIRDGAPAPSTIARAASEAHVDPSEMGTRVQSVMDAFRAQAVTAVAGYGSDDAEPFFAWAHANQPRGLREAMETHGMERSTRGYEPLYRSYVESIADHDPEAVLNAEFGGGIKAHRDGKHIVLTIPGQGTMTYRSAVQAGLIRVRGA